MRRHIPFATKRLQLLTQMVCGFKIHHSQALALEETTPQLTLIHPGAMHGRAVHHKAWMVDHPLADVLAMVRTDMVTDERNGLHGVRNRLVSMCQKREAFLRPCPFITLPIDLVGTGVQGGQAMEGTRTLILVLVSVGQVLRLGWPGRGATRARRQGRLLVHRPHQRIRVPRLRVEVNQLEHRGIEGGVPWWLGIEPDMLAPGFPLRRGQHPTHRGGREVLHEASADALPGQCFAIPR
jgi:hypothetical protein